MTITDHVSEHLVLGRLLPKGLAPNPPILLMRPKRNEATLDLLMMELNSCLGIDGTDKVII